MIIYKFAIDHFGIAGDQIMGKMLGKGTKRERKVYRNSLVTMAQASGAIGSGPTSSVLDVGYTIDKSGQKWIILVISPVGEEKLDDIFIHGV